MYIILFIVFKSFLFSETFDLLYVEANQLYINESYEKSIDKYEEIIAGGKRNSKIYYNLGNAYFRIDKIGAAIWAYENALRLDPRDKNIIYNLEIANNYKIDRISMPDTFFLLKVYRKMHLYFTFEEWVLFGSVLLFSLTLYSLLKNIYNFKSKVLQNIFHFLFFTIIIVSIIIIDGYFDKKYSYDQAIFIIKSEALSGPSYDNHKILFEVNEGSKAEIIRDENGWADIILLDGKSGWVKSKDIRLLE